MQPSSESQPKFSRLYVEAFRAEDLDVGTKDLVLLCNLVGDEIHSVSLHVAAPTLSKRFRGQN